MDTLEKLKFFLEHHIETLEGCEKSFKDCEKYKEAEKYRVERSTERDILEMLNNEKYLDQLITIYKK